MRAWFPALAVAAIAVSAPSPSPPSARDIDNVAAFARVYGVVRYFYPSDAAAELDWSRFAVHGVARARAARDAPQLATTLTRLFSPVGPGIAIGDSLPPVSPPVPSGEPLVAWRYLGAGFSAGGFSPYKAKRTHRPSPAPASVGFATLMQTVPAGDVRGQAVRLRARVRAVPGDPAAGAALWLRVDRAEGTMGFFDNMGDRLVRNPEWRDYSIEGTIADDAASLAFGVMVLGPVTADFDAVELAVRDAGGDWTPIPIPDPGFELAPDGPWMRTGPMAVTISRPEDGAPEGHRYCRFAPPLPGAADEELFDHPAPAPGDHVDFDLGSGLRARVPLTLTDRRARTAPEVVASLDALSAALLALPDPGGTEDLDTRLADVVVAWNAFRHFYPYWVEAGVDWDARLRSRLEDAATAAGREAQHDVLRRLTADLRDGHAGVRDTREQEDRAELPVKLRVLGGRLVVTASAAPAEARVGSVVSTIDGVPARDWLARARTLASGTPQWCDVRALWDLTSGAKGAKVRLGLDDGSGPREVDLAYAEAQALAEKRPDPIVEIEPQIWYVDLTRATMPEVARRLEALAAARGVAFDVRGYPGDAGAGVLPYLLDAPETDRWMHVAKIVGPFGRAAGWESHGWDIKPALPRIAGAVVFLTDERAISYAESVMGYVADRKLGTIVGGPTAGTNGNVASFTTPGGFSLHFTGMRVTGHDGASPFHLVGVSPDVGVAPTVEGLRDGRDEVLERGLAVLRAAAGRDVAP